MNESDILERVALINAEAWKYAHALSEKEREAALAGMYGNASTLAVLCRGEEARVDLDPVRLHNLVNRMQGQVEQVERMRSEVARFKNLAEQACARAQAAAEKKHR